jgi:hypothetical protein
MWDGLGLWWALPSGGRLKLCAFGDPDATLGALFGLP